MMIDIKTLQDKKIYELTTDEVAAIQDAYLHYFDHCGSLKKRAIGYCVIVGGVPVDSIGDFTLSFDYTIVDPTMPGGHGDEVGVGLSFGVLPVIPSMTDLLNPKYKALVGAIRDYIQKEPRFMEYLSKPPAKALPINGLRLPLFISNVGKTKGMPLKNCRTWMAEAGKAIGFNASKLKLHTLGNVLKVAGGMSWEPGKPIEFGPEIPLAKFARIMAKKELEN